MIRFDRVAQLASALGTTEANLHRLVRQRKQLYKHDIEIKPNGKKREFFKPKYPLKIIQKAIDQKILARFRVNSLVYGFIKGGSTWKCANVLIGCPCLLWVDISSFFPSITYHQVHRFFAGMASPSVANLLTDLTTWQNQLPQGTPTSPRLSNLANKSLDNRLGGLAQKHHLKIARYGDDIYFGGPRWISSLLDTVQKIVADEGYIVNAKKAEKGGIQFQDEPQIVLSSLIVNRTVGIAPNYYDEVRTCLAFIKRFGWNSAISNEIVKSQESLRGKIGYVQKASKKKETRFSAHSSNYAINLAEWRFELSRCFLSKPASAKLIQIFNAPSASTHIHKTAALASSDAALLSSNLPHTVQQGQFSSFALNTPSNIFKMERLWFHNQIIISFR